MPPKQKANTPREAMDFTVFQQALLAMQEHIQITIHASIMEMGDMFSQRLACQNPLFNNYDMEEDRSVHSNPFPICGRHGAQRHHNHRAEDRDHDRHPDLWLESLF